jgi:hypothetical protein
MYSLQYQVKAVKEMNMVFVSTPHFSPILIHA